MRIQVVRDRGEPQHINIEQWPDECPYCHRGVEPVFLFGFFNSRIEILHLSFYCPRSDCGNYFIGEYHQLSDIEFELNQTKLGVLETKSFSQTIAAISEDFVEIYEQAAAADYYGLNQICGVGYRKALEFLIKDYIIQGDEKLRDKVETLLLGKCINEYIQDQRIKDIAKRATWLGNDETHYIRKWIGKNVIDLKIMIDLMVHWIETEALSKQLILSMPDN